MKKTRNRFNFYNTHLIHVNLVFSINSTFFQLYDIIINSKGKKNMDKNKKLRIILWTILLLVILSLGILGLVNSGDLDSILSQF